MSTVQTLWTKSVFSPIPVRNTFEVTVERLAQAIRIGVLPEGQRLPAERELADMLGVSRVTLREAIRALRSAGLVRTRPGRGGGTFVIPVPGQPPDLPAALVAGMDDVLDLRRIVEAGAAELAARRKLSDDDRSTLTVCLRACRTDGPGRRLADSRLHMAIAAAAGNALLVEIIGDVELQVDALLRAIPVLPANIAHSDDQHEAMVAAILAGRPAQARATMEEHLDATASLLRGLLG